MASWRRYKIGNGEPHRRGAGFCGGQPGGTDRQPQNKNGGFRHGPGEMARGTGEREGDGVEAVLAYLKEKSALARFVRTKDEINKDAILNEKFVCGGTGAGH